MARDFDRAGSEFFTAASPPVTVAPLTMSAWFNADDVTNAHIIMALVESGGDDMFELVAQGNVAGDPIAARDLAGGAGTVAYTSVGYLGGVWNHAAAAFASSSSRTSYLNGGGAVEGTASVTPVGIDAVDIGRRGLAAPVYFGGSIAFPAIWKAALDPWELHLLSLGAHPSTIRRESLVFCPDMKGDGNLFDPISGLTLTENGVISEVADPYHYLKSPSDLPLLVGATSGAAAVHAGSLVGSTRLKSKVGGGLV